MQILEYLDVAGDSPYRDWFESLDAQAAAKVTVALTRIELGNLSNVKGVGAGVQEYRIDFGPGYRIYFGRDGDPSRDPIGGRHEEPPAQRHRDRAEAVGRLQEAQKWLIGNESPVAETPKLNEERPMALTRDFKETVKARADRDPAFREALLTEAVEHLITGKVDVGKAVLRDYINATIGFARLAKATGTPSKSLMRMLGPKGNPRANNLLAMIGKLQRVSGVRLAVGTGAKKRAA